VNANSRKNEKTGVPKVSVTVATFDRRHALPPYRAIRSGGSIRDWRPLTSEDYRPSGTTPLLDATAQFIGDLHRLRARGRVVIGALADESGSMSANREAVISGVNEFVESMRDVEVDPKADGKVLAVILTDGLENASEEVTGAQVKKLISDCESEGWTFIYMGANQDAWAAGGELGVSGSASGQRVNYVATAEGTRSALRETSLRAVLYLEDNVEFQLSAASAPDTTLTEAGELLANASPPPASS
jgi:hypothetical protein